MLRPISRSFHHCVTKAFLLGAFCFLIGGSPSAQPASSTAPQASNEAIELNNQGVRAAQSGDFEEAVRLVRQALAKAPDDPQFLKNLSAMLTQLAKIREDGGRINNAIDALQEAGQLDSTNWQAFARLGELRYVTQGDLGLVLDAWKRAYDAMPTTYRDVIAKRIAQAERDQTIERTFSSQSTAHFVIRFDGPEHASEAEVVGQALEQAYEAIKQRMGSGPSQVHVILYAGSDFQRVSGRRDWALGLYDGRIRLRREEVQSPLAPQLVAHELAHAFLATSYGPHLPTWLHEGFAQSQEPPGPQTERYETLLPGLTSRASWIPLKWLDRRFAQPSNLDDIERAYAEARYVVDRLIRQHGMARFQDFLGQLKAGRPVEEACERAFSIRWSRLDQGLFE